LYTITTAATMTNMSDLPNEILYAIMDRLSAQELLRMSRLLPQWEVVHAVGRIRHHLTLIIRSLSDEHSTNLVIYSKMRLFNVEEDDATFLKKLRWSMVVIDADNVNKCEQVNTLFPNMSRLQLILNVEFYHNPLEIDYCKKYGDQCDGKMGS